MRTLALDCSQSGLCLAILDGDQILAELSVAKTEPQSAILLKRIDELFTSAKVQLQDIQRVLFCRGPGSFTSLRIGLSTLMGLFLPVSQHIQYVETSSLLFRCLSVCMTKVPVRVKMKAGRNRAYVGELKGDIFAESVEFVDQDIVEDDTFDPKAFVEILAKPAFFKEQKLSEAQIEYLLAPDIG